MNTLKIIIGILTSIGFINMLIKFINHLKNSMNEEIGSDIVALIILGIISFFLFYSASKTKKKNTKRN